MCYLVTILIIGSDAFQSNLVKSSFLCYFVYFLFLTKTQTFILVLFKHNLSRCFKIIYPPQNVGNINLLFNLVLTFDKLLSNVTRYTAFKVFEYVYHFNDYEVQKVESAELNILVIVCEQLRRQADRVSSLCVKVEDEKQYQNYAY